ncbi:hypothetical protein ACJX0J_039557, partial [Zea mays]
YELHSLVMRPASGNIISMYTLHFMFMTIYSGLCLGHLCATFTAGLSGVHVLLRKNITWSKQFGSNDAQL